MRTRIFDVSFALFAFAAASADLAAARDAGDPGWGTTAAKGVVEGQRAPAEPISLGRIISVFDFNNAQVATGGVGLRNRGSGGIELSGLTGAGAMQAAILYWAVISSGPPPAASKRLKLQRLFPTPVSANVTVLGTSVGSGPTPCWIGDTITVFRGAPPTSVVTGNGLYVVRLLPGASGDTTGRDPFLNTTLPLFEGASLVAVANGGATISVYDKDLAGATFSSTDGLLYSLVTPAPVDTASLVVWHNIGADGQRGSAFLPDPRVANELTLINGVRVAGDGAPDRDSDWNGSSAKPVTQLWDDTGHDATVAAHAATAANQLKVKFIKTSPAGGSDCLTPVANVVQRQ